MSKIIYGKEGRGFFRIVKKSGKYYVIKVRNRREGKKVIQEFVVHVGILEDIQKAVCSVQK